MSARPVQLDIRLLNIMFRIIISHTLNYLIQSATIGPHLTTSIPNTPYSLLLAFTRIAQNGLLDVKLQQLNSSLLYLCSTRSTWHLLVLYIHNKLHPYIQTKSYLTLVTISIAVLLPHIILQGIHPFIDFNSLHYVLFPHHYSTPFVSLRKHKHPFIPIFLTSRSVLRHQRLKQLVSTISIFPPLS